MELRKRFNFYKGLLEEVNSTPPKEKHLEALLEARVAAQEKMVEVHEAALAPKKKGVLGRVFNKINFSSTKASEHTGNRKAEAEEQSKQLDVYTKELRKLKISKKPGSIKTGAMERFILPPLKTKLLAAQKELQETQATVGQNGNMPTKAEKEKMEKLERTIALFKKELRYIERTVPQETSLKAFLDRRKGENAKKYNVLLGTSSTSKKEKKETEKKLGGYKDLDMFYKNLESSIQQEQQQQQQQQQQLAQ